MILTELEERIINHEIHGLKIIDYARDVLSFEDVNSKTTVEDMNITIAKFIKQRFPMKGKKYTAKETAKVEVFMAGYYRNLPKMIEEYRCENIEIKKLIEEAKSQFQGQQEPLVPLYIQKLIHDKLVYPPDGKRATGKLDDIAIFLVDKLGMDLKWRYLTETFTQSTGKSWSEGAARKALRLAYNPHLRRNKDEY